MCDCVGSYDVSCWPRCKLQDEGDLDAQKNCPIHRRPCQQRSEQNYFFRLSRYQQRIEVGRYGPRTCLLSLI